MATNLEIKEGKNTPKIEFDTNKGIFSITGKSFPENAKEFYGPIYTWLDGFVPNKDIQVVFSLYYVSSSSIISILEMIRRFDKMSVGSIKVVIDWHFEKDDDDIKKVGEDYQKISNLKINLLEH